MLIALHAVLVVLSVRPASILPSAHKLIKCKQRQEQQNPDTDIFPLDLCRFAQVFQERHQVTNRIFEFLRRLQSRFGKRQVIDHFMTVMLWRKPVSEFPAIATVTCGMEALGRSLVVPAP